MAEDNENRPYDAVLDAELFAERGWDQFLVQPVSTYRKIVEHARDQKKNLMEKGEASKKKDKIDARAVVLNQLRQEHAELGWKLDAAIDEFLQMNEMSPAEMAAFGEALKEWGEHFAYLGGLKVEAEILNYRKQNADSADEEELAEIREDFNRTVALAKSIGAMLNILPVPPEDKKEEDYPTLQAVQYGLGTVKNRSKYPVKVYQAQWSLVYPNGVLDEFQGGIAQFACEYLIPSMGIQGKGFTVEDLIELLNKENENWSKTGEKTTITVLGEWTIEVVIAQKK